MGDESSEMWTELNSTSQEGGIGWTVGEEEPGYFDDMRWEPTPIDALPGFFLRSVVNIRLPEDDIRRYSFDAVEYLRYEGSLCQGTAGHSR